MTTRNDWQTPRPWLAAYGNRPTTLQPASQTGLDMFQATVGRTGDGPLVHYFGHTLSANEVDRMSDALAVALQRRGVERGDRVATLLQNVPQALVTILAAWKCGAVVVPCNPMLRERELTAVLADSGTRVLVSEEQLYVDVAKAAAPAAGVGHVITTSPLDLLGLPERRPLPLADAARCSSREVPDLLDLMEEYSDEQPGPVALRGEDVAFMVYTSGTTGTPKAALNTHANVVFASAVYERWIGLTASDVILAMAPLFHVTGLIGHLGLAMLTGSPVVLFYRFDAAEACRLAELYRATFTVSAVTAFIALLNTPYLDAYDLSSLTKVYTGGAPTPASTLDQWFARTGTRLHPMYGLTEATSPTHMTPYGVAPPVDAATGVVSVGLPVFDTDVRVVDAGNQECGTGEIGELVIAGPQIVPGYWNKPDETAVALGAGRLRTGDMGFMNEDGWFFLVDRAKDMIVASGFKVWPREVEEVLHLHPAVREAAVVGVPDAYRGETIMAVVCLKAGYSATPGELQAFARAHLAAYKRPRIVEIVDELPKTLSGKILRRLLRDEAVAKAVPRAS